MLKYSNLILAILIVISNFALAQEQKSKSMDSSTMTLTKTFNVPLEMLWKAWSHADYVKQWWGPEGFTAPMADINLKKDSTSLVCMRSPDGFEIYNSWTYTQILPMYSIEFVQHFTDKDGNKLNPAAIGLPPGIPEAVPHVIRFEDMGNGATKLTVTESGYSSSQVVEISKAGMLQCLTKMEKLLEKEKANGVQKSVIKQLAINTTPAKLWKVLTSPEAIKQWLGGANTESSWTSGSPITFTGNWNGKEYKDKGVVLQFIPEKVFQFSYWSSFSGLPDSTENYSIIRLEIVPKDKSVLLILSQSNFATATMYEHSAKNWDESLQVILASSEKK